MIEQRSTDSLKWFAGMLVVSVVGCGSEAAAPASDAAPGVMAPASMMAAAPSPSAGGKPATMAMVGKPASGGSPASLSTSPSASPATGGAGAAASSPAATGGKPAAAEGGTSGGGVVAAGSGGQAAASGSGGSAGSAADAGAAGEPAVAMHEDLGKGDGTDVVLMGDSWMSNTLQVEGTGGGLAPSLQSAAGQPYRNYGVQGVMLLSADTFGPAIPTQWDTAKAVNPSIKTVIMTGGGNDVIQNPGLQSDCRMNGDQCKMFRLQLMAALDKLWTQMAADGVRDIVYVRYSSNAGGGNNSGGMTMPPDQQTQQDMTVPVCLTDKITCHALDTNDLVMNDLAADGIHPLFTANDRMAKAIVDMMEKAGMRR